MIIDESFGLSTKNKEVSYNSFPYEIEMNEETILKSIQFLYFE